MKIKMLIAVALLGAASMSAHAGVRFGFSVGLPLPPLPVPVLGVGFAGHGPGFFRPGYCGPIVRGPVCAPGFPVARGQYYRYGRYHR